MNEKEKEEVREWLDRCVEVIKALDRFPESITGARLSLPSSAPYDAYLMYDCWKVAIPLGLQSEIEEVSDSDFGFIARYYIEYGGIRFFTYMTHEELEKAKKMEEEYEV